MKKEVKKNIKKEKTKEKKGPDKVIVTTVILCVALVVGIILLIVLPEPIAAAENLNKAREFLASEEKIFAVGIIAVSERSEDYVTSPSAVLYDEDAESFSNDVKKLLKNVKYSDTTTVKLGVWKTKIELNNETDRFTFFVDKEGVYIQDGNKLIHYTVNDKGRADFDALNARINSELE